MLPEKIDRRKVYYKVTNTKENHNGLQYRNGLIVDPVEFNDNPKSSCVPGGIYFTTAEYLHKFFSYGKNIRPIKVPKDAKVVLDPDGDKYRADKVVMLPKKDIAWYFRNLWDPDKFNWRYSHLLAKYASQHFDKWWDSEKFDFYYSEYLAEYCFEHFEKWWDPEKFNWDHSRYLAMYAFKYFDKWWDSDKFDWEYSDYLAINVSNDFDKWWDPEKFNWKYSNYLEKYCSDYRDIWEKDLKKRS